MKKKQRKVIPYSDLLIETEQAFSFLVELGYIVSDKVLISPKSFKGGFRLEYISEINSIVISYLEYEAQVKLSGQEIFGSVKHQPFAGNMFSQEHYSEILPELARHVKNKLTE